jgi:hypothetical protein
MLPAPLNDDNVSVISVTNNAEISRNNAITIGASISAALLYASAGGTEGVAFSDEPSASRPSMGLEGAGSDDACDDELEKTMVTIQANKKANRTVTAENTAM